MLLWPIFFFSSCAHHRALHSFPTRRSSDLARFEAAYDFVRQTVAQGESVLFVGTKRQAREIVEEEAKRCQMFYVSERWLGGMLTNFNTIRKSIDKLRKIESSAVDGRFDRLPKKDVALLEKDSSRPD